MGGRQIAGALVALVLWSASAPASAFDLARCEVGASSGELVKIQCGGVVYWVIGRERAAECAAWSRDCATWETRSRLLDEALRELDRGRLLLAAAKEGADFHRAQSEALQVMIEDLETDLRRQWSTLEVVGLVTLGGLGGFVAGAVVALFAF